MRRLAIQKPNDLTAIERRIVTLLAEGYLLHQIAEQLHWSLKAVHVRVKVLEQRFGVASRAELIEEANRRGLLEDR